MPTEASFALTTNTGTPGRVLLFVAGLNVVALPLAGVVTWLALEAFGPAVAMAAGVAVLVPVLVVMATLFTRKTPHRLTVTPFAVTLLDARGRVVTKLDRRAVSHELASHTTSGRLAFHIPVVVVRGDAGEIAVGAMTFDEPPAGARRVSAPPYLVEAREIGRLVDALGSPVS